MPGASAMPQRGHRPGWRERTSGSMGQTNSTGGCAANSPGARGVAVAGWSGGQTRRGEQAGRLELRPALAINIGPLARGLARCELAGVAVVVEPLDEAVDPSEAERFANGVLVGDRLHAGVIF